jgi:hypothetical protein
MPTSLDNVPLQAGVPTTEEAARLITKAQHLGESLAASIATHARAVEAAELRFNEECHGHLGPNDHPAAKESAGRAAEKKLTEFRNLLVTETQSARDDQIRQLRETAERLSLADTLYPSTVALLSSSGLGSRERTEYLAQLVSAGPAELSTYARFAIARGDRLLGAAVLSRLDSLPRDGRPFSAHDFAEKLVGEDHRKLTDAAKRARLLLETAVAANNELATGRPDSNGKIARALRARELTRKD